MNALMRRVRQQKVPLMIDRMFRAHPREVGESYGQHWRVATGFGVRMVAGGLATIVHGFDFGPPIGLKHRILARHAKADDSK